MRSQLKPDAKGRPSLFVLISTSLALTGVSLHAISMICAV